MAELRQSTRAFKVSQVLGFGSTAPLADFCISRIDIPEVSAVTASPTASRRRRTQAFSEPGSSAASAASLFSQQQVSRLRGPAKLNDSDRLPDRQYKTSGPLNYKKTSVTSETVLEISDPATFLLSSNRFPEVQFGPLAFPHLRCGLKPDSQIALADRQIRCRSAGALPATSRRRRS